MIDAIFSVLDKLPPLRKEKNPNLAAAIGFMFGGIGLLFYGFAFIDMLFALGLFVLLFVVLQGIDPSIGFLVGAIISGLYGYFRALSSNKKLGST